MDYGFSEEQELFRRSVRTFLEKEYPRSLPRQLEEDQLDYPRHLYLEMARLGWCGLMIPERYGGMGMGWVEVALFYEEAGRALLRSPHLETVVLGGQLILALGNEEQRRRLLPRIVRGEITLTLALTEPDAGNNLALMSTSAEARGDGYLLKGSKLFVKDAPLADYLLTVARLEEGAGLFLVPRAAAGVNILPLDTLIFSGERLSEVSYQGTGVAAEELLGKPGSGQAVFEAVDRANLALAAEAVGGAQVSLDMAISYAKEREQFDAPIGSFQALQHKMANVQLAIDGARWLTYYAAWLMSEGLPSTKERAMAQLQAGATYRQATAEATQIQGGVSIMREHDMTLYYSRAKALQLRLGPPDVIRETIAQALEL